MYRSEGESLLGELWFVFHRTQSGSVPFVQNKMESMLNVEESDVAAGMCAQSDEVP